MSLLSHIVEKRVPRLLLQSFFNHSSTLANRFVQQASSQTKMTEGAFIPKRVLVLRKFSRLEYERLCHPNLTEEQLAANVSDLINYSLSIA